MSSTWAKQSVICVLAAAGTILGSAAIAAGQGAVVVQPQARQERRQVEVRELRRGEPHVRVERGEMTDDREVSVYVQGQEGARAWVKPQVRVEHGEITDDGQVRVYVQGQEAARAQGGAKARSNQVRERVVVGKQLGGQGGNICESCGQPRRDGRSDGGAQGQVRERVILRGGAAGGSGGAEAPRKVELRSYGHGGGAPHIQHFGGEGGKFEFRTFGHGEGEPHIQYYGEGGPGKVELRKFVHPQGEPFQMRFYEGGKGQGGQRKQGVKVEEHVVIVGPDGERREWRSGGPEGKAGQNDAQVFEFRDGGEGGGHLFLKPDAKKKPAGKGGAEPKKIELRRGRQNMNVV